MHNIDLTRLAQTDDEVARLARPAREARLDDLIAESNALLDEATRIFVTEGGKTLVGTVGLYSGGNDSTLLMHLFRDRVTHAAHANTGIGIEQTREFVRSTCRAWGIPLLERSSPRPEDSYEALVLDQGFPGPAHHYKQYQRLKERALRVVRKELVGQQTRTNRVIFLAGRRRQESDRRAEIPEFEREGSIVWVSPLVNWTKIDMNTYRLRHRDIPRNEVSDLIHMSGECLCGAFAHTDEFHEIEMWFPEVTAHIAALEAKVRATGKHPEWRCRWGWGADKSVIEKMKKSGMSDADIAKEFARSESGPLCSSCAGRGDAEQQAATVTS